MRNLWDKLMHPSVEERLRYVYERDLFEGSFLQRWWDYLVVVITLGFIISGPWLGRWW